MREPEYNKELPVGSQNSVRRKNDVPVTSVLSRFAGGPTENSLSSPFGTIHRAFWHTSSPELLIPRQA
jgi:hypothetical protein